MELDTTTTHPHPHPHPHHRKIELQSALDLAYLQSNMSASVRQKLDLHFPPSASQPPPLPSATTQHDATATAGPDPMRQRVEDLVAQFLDRVWRAAKANIAVNGQDATTTAFGGGPAEPPHTKHGGGTREQEEEEKEREGVDFEYEPYDARLSARVAGLYAEVESLTAHVSRLRRTAPREAAERYAGVLGTVLEEDGKRKEEFGDGDGDGDGAGAGAGGLLKLDVVRDGWEEDVAAAYDRGVEELRRLGGLAGGGLDLGDGEGSGSGGGSLTETVGRVQRAKMVALELE